MHSAAAFLQYNGVSAVHRILTERRLSCSGRSLRRRRCPNPTNRGVLRFPCFQVDPVALRNKCPLSDTPYLAGLGRAPNLAGNHSG